jgi:hypothetical protein
MTDYFALAERNLRAQFPIVEREDEDLAEIRRREANDAIYVEAVRTWFKRTDPAVGDQCGS